MVAKVQVFLDEFAHCLSVCETIETQLTQAQVYAMEIAQAQKQGQEEAQEQLPLPVS
jgi:hypothetical protein